MCGQLSESGSGPMCSTVGLVSDDDVGTVGLREAVRGADADLRAGSAAGVLDADTDAVVALGERALVDLVAAGLDSDRPVLPVDAGASVRSVPRSAAPGAVEALLDGSWTPVELPLLSAQGADALFDFTLVTSEPARISEYTVVSGEERVATVRADAVVVTTPTGSPGYAKAADGPVLAPGTGVIGVVPVAPFATDADHWVLPDDAVRLVVERDEAPVELLADGRSVGTVPANEPIPIARERSLTVAVVEGSQRFFG